MDRRGYQVRFPREIYIWPRYRRRRSRRFQESPKRSFRADRSPGHVREVRAESTPRGVYQPYRSIVQGNLDPLEVEEIDRSGYRVEFGVRRGIERHGNGDRLASPASTRIRLPGYTGPMSGNSAQRQSGPIGCPTVLIGVVGETMVVTVMYPVGTSGVHTDTQSYSNTHAYAGCSACTL